MNFLDFNCHAHAEMHACTLFQTEKMGKNRKEQLAQCRYLETALFTAA